MAKLTDKFFNRVIEGPLELESEDEGQIKDLAEDVIEAGETTNAKPIYFHGIRVVSESLEGRITFTILNNSPTPFTKDTILPFIKGLMDNDARIIANGYVINASNVLINVYEIAKAAENTYYIYGNSDSARLNVNLNDITIQTLNDGVNKIN